MDAAEVEDLGGRLLYYPDVLSKGTAHTSAMRKRSKRVDKKRNRERKSDCVKQRKSEEWVSEEAISRLFLIMFNAFSPLSLKLPAPHLDALSCQNYFISVSAFTISEGGMQGNDVQGTD